MTAENDTRIVWLDPQNPLQVVGRIIWESIRYPLTTTEFRSTIRKEKEDQ